MSSGELLTGTVDENAERDAQSTPRSQESDVIAMRHRQPRCREITLSTSLGSLGISSIGCVH